jgi:hypothetical protein
MAKTKRTISPHDCYWRYEDADGYPLTKWRFNPEDAWMAAFFSTGRVFKERTFSEQRLKDEGYRLVYSPKKETPDKDIDWDRD